MKFHADGPSIPSSLLRAADEGNVVFVCGAGVSLARARLPTFQQLLNSVVSDLRPAPGGAASDLLRAERELIALDPPIRLPSGVAGFASADRLFGLLEAEFGVPGVEAAVARQLQTPADVDLSAHRTLLRLARSTGGPLRLVTTNFDLLFESAAAGDDLRVYLPTVIPETFDGLVKIHGSLNDTGEGATTEGFVLSTATFGHAYIAEGWAARFMRAILTRNTVVFVGYAADDPPMQYLLEAIARTDAADIDAYAFQADNGIGSRWAARGVEPIVYTSVNGHRALWETIDAWSSRVAEPTAWRSLVARQALVGPRDLSSHERGQVAELIGSTAGAEAFLKSDEQGRPPAEWLCVFDRNCRFAAPGRETPYFIGSKQPKLDPLNLYGLDDDPQVNVDVAEGSSQTRSAPEVAWDGLQWTERDREEMRAAERKESQGTFRSPRIQKQAMGLPPRLHLILSWLCEVAREPAAVWWAVRHGPVNSSFAQRLRHRLPQVISRPSEAPSVWSMILETWETPRAEWSSDADHMAVADLQRKRRFSPIEFAAFTCSGAGRVSF